MLRITIFTIIFCYNLSTFTPLFIIFLLILFCTNMRFGFCVLDLKHIYIGYKNKKKTFYLTKNLFYLIYIYIFTIYFRTLYWVNFNV